MNRPLTTDSLCRESAATQRQLDGGCRNSPDLTRQLRQERAAMREAERRKHDFLAMLAHELRNPLATVGNGLHILNRLGPTGPARDALEMMGRQVDHLVHLVDDLLDVGRVTEGKIQLRKERADFGTVLARALESSSTFIEEHGHRLEVSLPEAALPVEADVLRVAQIVTNLLSNAAKFTPPGGTIRLAIERRGASGAGEAVVRVTDSGVGISPEVLPHVFDLFTQADPTVSPDEGGLGIGLTLARHLAEMHGGSLEASSAGAGQGSEFTLRLPLVAAQPNPPDQAEGAHPAPPRAPSRRVLVVDDNRDAANSLAVLLRLMGHEVRQASDPHEALAVATAFVPEVIVLDIGMPGMSGYEVARELRSQAELSAALLVALTGYGSEEDRQRSFDAGFHAHLVKPVDLDALEVILTSLAPR